MKDGWMRSGEVKALLGVSYSTLQRWANAGKIRATRDEPGSNRRFWFEDVEELMRDMVDRGDPGVLG